MSEETHDHTHDHTHEAPSPDPSALPEGVKFRAGFAVLIGDDGAVFIEKDLSQFKLPVDREATLLEIRRYTSEILMDLQAQAAAEYTSLRIAAESAASQA
jgi:hypothetical protein